MITLMIAVLLGLGFAYLATQNTLGVPLRVGYYEWANIPLYMVALGSLLLGLIISAFLGLFDFIATAFTIKGKDDAVHQAERTVQNLDKKIHELELENARLRGEKREEQVKREYVEAQPARPNLFDKLRHNISV